MGPESLGTCGIYGPPTAERRVAACWGLQVGPDGKLVALATPVSVNSSSSWSAVAGGYSGDADAYPYTSLPGSNWRWSAVNCGIDVDGAMSCCTGKAMLGAPCAFFIKRFLALTFACRNACRGPKQLHAWHIWAWRTTKLQRHATAHCCAWSLGFCVCWTRINLCHQVPGPLCLVLCE